MEAKQGSKVFPKSKKSEAKKQRQRERKLAKGWVTKKGFYDSWEWKKLRYEVLKTYGAICMLCHTHWHIVVDHIKPRSRYPALALDFDNMQVLCNDCNKGKAADDETDFRPKLPEPELTGDEAEHMRSILN